MYSQRASLHRFAWIALIAAFALALVPTISRALTTLAGQSAWAEVCTPQGMKVVALESERSDERMTGSLAGHLDHCPICVLGASLPGLPAALVSMPVRISLSGALPVLVLRGPRTLYAWTSAQPRAPPLVS